MITIKRFEVNPLSENCYVVSDESKECVIIDCGAFYPEEKEAIKRYLAKEDLKLVHVLNTHLHFDHVWGNQFLLDTYGLNTEASARDNYLYVNVPEQERMLLGQSFCKNFTAFLGKNLEEGSEICFGSHTFKVIATPGHTPGGICFYCKEENVLFSGDSLFNGSIGRTDLPNGSLNDLVTSLREKVLTLPEETQVYPGHGPSSKIESEKRYNPYLAN